MASVGQPAAVRTKGGTEIVPYGLTTGVPDSCWPPKELQPSNPPNRGPSMVSVAYVSSMSGCPSTDSKIQASPSIGNLVGLGSGTAVASATSVGVTGCGLLQATAIMTKRANIAVAAPRVARGPCCFKFHQAAFCERGSGNDDHDDGDRAVPEPVLVTPSGAVPGLRLSEDRYKRFVFSATASSLRRDAGLCVASAMISQRRIRRRPVSGLD